MEEKETMDQTLLDKLNRLNESWPIHRRDLTHIIYFSLAVIALTFFNLKAIDLVAGSPVVKVIDVFALLLLFIVPNWAFIERSQGDRLRPLLQNMGVEGFNPGDPVVKDELQEAAAFADFVEKGYPFILMMGGMGIITLNIIAYVVYGPAPG